MCVSSTRIVRTHYWRSLGISISHSVPVKDRQFFTYSKHKKVNKSQTKKLNKIKKNNGDRELSTFYMYVKYNVV